LISFCFPWSWISIFVFTDIRFALLVFEYPSLLIPVRVS
jgi:hypothetical protein